MIPNGKQRIETRLASRAILQAIDDLERVEHMTGYRVNMAVWHEQDDEDDVCAVCLGGAMLARVTGFNSDKVLEPGMLDDPDEERVVGAMDLIRMNSLPHVRHGLKDLGASTTAVESALGGLYGALCSYRNDPAKFKLQRRAIAHALAYHGE